MPVDAEQWHAEIGKFNGCLHYAVIKLKLNLFHDMASVNDSNISANELSKDLQKISEWAYKWKLSFNPDLNKQAQEVVFSRKVNKSSHPKIFFNNAPVICASWQKHLGMFVTILKKKCPKQ